MVLAASGGDRLCPRAAIAGEAETQEAQHQHRPSRGLGDHVGHVGRNFDCGKVGKAKETVKGAGEVLWGSGFSKRRVAGGEQWGFDIGRQRDGETESIQAAADRRGHDVADVVRPGSVRVTVCVPAIPNSVSTVPDISTCPGGSSDSFRPAVVLPTVRVSELKLGAAWALTEADSSPSAAADKASAVFMIQPPGCVPEVILAGLWLLSTWDLSGDASPRRPGHLPGHQPNRPRFVAISRPIRAGNRATMID